MRLLAVLAAAFLLLQDASALGRGGDEPPPAERPTAGGRLAWAVGDDVDLVGDTWVDLPLPVGERDSLFLSLDTRVTLERPSRFTFEVDDLQYALDAGWRERPRWLGGHTLAAFVGQRGRERVDANGQGFVQYAALAFESADFRRFLARRFDWKVAFGPVLKDREVEADLMLRARTQLWLGSAGIGPSSAVGLDLEIDGLIEDGSLDADRAFGPRLSVPMGQGRRATLYLHHLTGEHPLGTSRSLWLVGFSFDEGLDGADGSCEAPGVDGQVAVGTGEGRIGGEFALRLLSPPFGGSWRGTVSVDGNLLTAEDTGELYYTYDLGIERLSGGKVAGGYFHHRSNHQLAEPGDRVTSLNVLELGVESLHWRGPAHHEPGAVRGVVDVRARLGYLLDSSFGEDERWHVRAGLRWSLPGRVGSALVPYLAADAEAGDVRRQSFAAGARLLAGLEAQLERRHDEQYFGRDRDASLLIVRYRF